ncbi:hypothetical protein JXL19_10835 [bacterium]|nr:hypothetical protein [bacterium]
MSHTHVKKLSKSIGFFRRTNLYSLDNHLLVEKIGGYTAEYRRFFYDDIISLIAYKNPYWKLHTLADVILISGILILIASLFARNSLDMAAAVSFFLVPAMLFLLIDLLLGPTSRGQIRTVTSTEDIVFARRYRKSKKVLQTIHSLIQDRQGQIDSASLTGESLEYMGPMFCSPVRKLEQRGEEQKIPATKYNALYSFFLILLFLEVIVSAIQIQFPGDIATLLGTYSVAVMIVNLVVLFKQWGLYIRPPLRFLSWSTFLMFLSSMFVSSIMGAVIIFEKGLMPEAQYVTLIQTDPRYMTIRMIYLGLEILMVVIGAVISLKGHHSVYTKVT